MGICLCCQEKTENRILYHEKCLKELFNTEKVPEINFTSAELISEISRNIGRMSISGVQIKVSVKLNRKNNLIEIVETGGTHILKPEPTDYPELPQNENLCMNIAKALKMEIPPRGLFHMADEKLCYIIKRFDRDENGQKIHVEDMAQLMNLPSDSKYGASLEKVGNIIIKFSKRPYLDLLFFLERAIFCFLIGNGDMHLKNWSLIASQGTKKGTGYGSSISHSVGQGRDTEQGHNIRHDLDINEGQSISQSSGQEANIGGSYQLSPCYDLICSKLYLPGEDESALTINGKRNRLTLSDFVALAEYLKIDKKAFNNIIDKSQGSSSIFLDFIENAVYFKRAEELKGIFKSNYEKLFQIAV